MVLGLVLGLVFGLMPSSDIVLKSTVLSSSCVPVKLCKRRVISEAKLCDQALHKSTATLLALLCPVCRVQVTTERHLLVAYLHSVLQCVCYAEVLTGRPTILIQVIK